MFYIGLYEITCAYLVRQLSADKFMYTYLTCKIGRRDFVCAYFGQKSDTMNFSVLILSVKSAIVISSEYYRHRKNR